MTENLTFLENYPCKNERYLLFFLKCSNSFTIAVVNVTSIRTLATVILSSLRQIHCIWGERFHIFKYLYVRRRKKTVNFIIFFSRHLTYHKTFPSYYAERLFASLHFAF